MGSLSLRQGIFPTQGLNPGLPHCRQTLYQLSHRGSPRILAWVAYPFSSRSSQARNWTGVSCTAGGFFTYWAFRYWWQFCHSNCHQLCGCMCPWSFPLFPISLTCQGTLDWEKGLWTQRGCSWSTYCLYWSRSHETGAQAAQGALGAEPGINMIIAVRVYWASLVAQRWRIAGSVGAAGGNGFDPRAEKIPLEQEMATHFSILAWEIPWTEEPGGLQSIGSQRVGRSWSDLACTRALICIKYIKSTKCLQSIKMLLLYT